MKPRVLNIIDEIVDAEKLISNASFYKKQAEEELEEMLNPFKINGLKSLIAKKIMEGMDSSYIEKIMADRKDELDNFAACTSISTEEPFAEMHSVTYKCSNIFDPEHDEFRITHYTFNEDKTKVKFHVECVKNRQYLGITGSWIPSMFSTVWIDKEELYNFD